ncbi:MAG: hypothetical protein WEA09_15080 [Gemmatimonadota bacterium]
MRDVVRFGAVLGGLVLSFASVAAAFWWDGGWLWMAAGAWAGWLVQLPLFAWMRWTGGRESAFLVAWVGGMLLRLLAVGIAGLIVVVWEGVQPAPFLLALVAVLFVSKLLEPRFLPWTRDDDRGRSRT